MPYKTSPNNTTGMPGGIAHIIGNEAAERFSFYGMKAVLAVFMVKYLHLMNDKPGIAMSQAQATENIHIWVGWVYLTPFLGALLADILFGKYRTIISLSIVYCAGHAALAVMGIQGDARWWLIAGLALIALGSGGIKPCVSAHVGDQFGSSNAQLLPKVFNWFYFSINLGAMLSMMLTPWLMEWYGPHLAFGVPGVLMGLATLVFWMGRKKFVHVPAGGARFLEELGKKATWSTLLRLLPLYIFLAIFWALFDQTGSTWIFQAQDMDRNFLGTTWLPSQVQSLNSLFVLTFIPLFTYILYPTISKIWPLTPLRKIGIGLFVMAAAFALVSLTQTHIDTGATPNIGWQVLSYALLTASEVMVSIVALEFAYTQAPRTMKSLVMCFYLGAVALGNFFTAGVNAYIQIDSPFEHAGDIELLAAKDDSSIPAMVHSGYDSTIGTADDLIRKDNTIHSPARLQLSESATAVESIYRHTQELPTTERGNKALASIADPWGSPLRYTRLNSRTARISSSGPDKTPHTKWDLSVTLEAPEEKTKNTHSWLDAFKPKTPWLERRKAEIGLGNKSKQDETTSILTKTYTAGEGTKLEGSSYFWFFTKLMLATAVLFIPYSLFYKEKTYLQE